MLAASRAERFDPLLNHTSDHPGERALDRVLGAGESARRQRYLDALRDLTEEQVRALMAEC